jgi:glucan phosphorylase
MNAKKSLTQTSNEEISGLFKMMLMLVEDMKQDHNFHYQKLYDNIPEQYHPVINTANHFTEEKIAWIRKRILDYGNESIRNLQSEIDNYSVGFIFK